MTSAISKKHFTFLHLSTLVNRYMFAYNACFNITSGFDFIGWSPKLVSFQNGGHLNTMLHFNSCILFLLLSVPPLIWILIKSKFVVFSGKLGKCCKHSYSFTHIQNTLRGFRQSWWHQYGHIFRMEIQFPSPNMTTVFSSNTF